MGRLHSVAQERWKLNKQTGKGHQEEFPDIMTSELRHRWWKRMRQQHSSGRKGRGQSKCKGPEIETKVACSRKRKKTAWLEPGEQRGEWKTGQMERLTPLWNVKLPQYLVILWLSFYLVMALSVSPTIVILSEKMRSYLFFYSFQH